MVPYESPTMASDVLTSPTEISSQHSHWVSWLISKRAVWALVDQAVVSCASFIVSLVIGRYLGKENLGIYFLAAGLFTIAQCICDQLIHVPYLVHAPHFDSRRTRVYSASAAVHCAILSIVAMMAIVLAANYQPATVEGVHLRNAMLVLAICFPGLMLRDFLHNYLHNRLRQFEVTCLDALVTSLQLITLSVLMLSNSLSVENALLGIGAACMVVSVAWLPRVASELEFQPRQFTPDFSHNWGIGKWALGSYLIGSSAPTILPWFLASAAGVDDTGLFAACLTLIGIAQVLLRGAGKYMAPRMVVAFVDGGRTALRTNVRVTLRYSLALMTPVTTVLCVFGGAMVRFAFGAQYANADSTVWVLSLGCWLQTIDIVVGNALLAMGLSKLNFVGDCARSVVTIVCAFLLIGEHGPFGAAMSLVVGTVAGLIVRGIYFWRELESNRSDANPVLVS